MQEKLKTSEPGRPVRVEFTLDKERARRWSFVFENGRLRPLREGEKL